MPTNTSYPPFLSFVSSDLLSRYGDSISDLCLVFPSRRAGLFFSAELTKLLKKPIWQPVYAELEQVFSNLSSLKIASQYSLLVDLYDVYCHQRQSDETFDHFYFWGEMLLRDFDTIDKYRVNAKMLFQNLAHQKKLEGDFSFLSDDQIIAVRQFWDSFDPANESALQQSFISTWEKLFAVYTDFKRVLRDKNESYSGMLYRDAAEQLKTIGTEVLPYKHYVFIGFNALNECEKSLFDWFKQNKKADFYWDYDNYYVQNKAQEAGLFLRYNIHAYPQVNYEKETSFFSKEKDIKFIAVPSDVGQAKLIPTLIEGMEANADRQTAIVLADENLLIPVLHSLPQSAQNINVTMGFPLKQTPVYSLCELLIRLQKTSKERNNHPVFYYKEVLALLAHPYVKAMTGSMADDLKNVIIAKNNSYVTPLLAKDYSFLSDLLVKITDYQAMCGYLLNVLEQVATFNQINETKEERQLRQEYVFYAITELNKLKSSIDEKNMPIGLSVFLNLLSSVFQSMRTPFTGEPISGLQIMGVLETRLLDFDNLIILSMNEDVFPQSGNVPSFIPYNLRRGFGIPTLEQQEAIYAYYFYRLLQRAQKVRLLYNTKADDSHTGEMSRFLYQLKMESPHKVKEDNLSLEIAFPLVKELSIEKDSAICNILNDYQGDNPKRSLSPSALSCYVACPLQFYFKYIAGLRERDEVEDEIDASLFGNLFHRSMEILYTPFLGQELVKETIVSIAKDDGLLEQAILKAFEIEFFRDKLPPDFGSQGKWVMNKEVIKNYIKGLLYYDANNNAPFIIKSLEDAIEIPYAFQLNEKTTTIRLKGIMDRLEEKNNAIRIVDYKTGAVKNTFKDLEALFSDKMDERNPAVLQTFIYAMMYNQKYEGLQLVTPTLYFVRGIRSADFSPLIVQKSANNYTVTNIADYLGEFIPLLNDKLSGLFNPAVPFTQTADNNTCHRACPYAQICRK